VHGTSAAAGAWWTAAAPAGVTGARCGISWSESESLLWNEEPILRLLNSQLPTTIEI
jgi:hypothetical protein